MNEKLLSLLSAGRGLLPCVCILSSPRPPPPFIQDVRRGGELPFVCISLAGVRSRSIVWRVAFRSVNREGIFGLAH